jgi:hypothetical protein
MGDAALVLSKAGVDAKALLPDFRPALVLYLNSVDAPSNAVDYNLRFRARP